MAKSFDVTEFFKCLMQDTALQGIVGMYGGKAAIAEEFPKTPDDVFITLCDQDLKYTYCPGTSDVISGRFDFSIKLFGQNKTSRAQLRDKGDILTQALKEFADNCVSGIRIDARSNNLIDSELERPFIAIQARAYFR